MTAERGCAVNDGVASAQAREARRYIEHVSSQHRSAAIDDDGSDGGSRGAAPGPASTGSASAGDGAGARAAAAAGVGTVAALGAQEYRIDLERIRFSSYFARLSDVTQVVPRSGVGPVMHNRLTHSLKVSAVARVIAAQLAGSAERHRAFARGERKVDDVTGAAVVRLGGCDSIVAQAAAHAHGLGHPPFGHLGERVLDRVARDQLGLAEGFEGNAQSFRILTRLDTLGRDFPGLNLTSATLAATLKYPWTRAEWAGVSESSAPATERPRGVGTDTSHGAEKFSAYALDAAEMRRALAAFPAIGRGVQTVECAVMDLADDIAYAVHDLDDFTRAGVLQRAAVAGEFRAWRADAGQLAALSSAELGMVRFGSGGGAGGSGAGIVRGGSAQRVPGYALERLWRRLATKDDWIADRDAFADAVERVGDEVGEQLLAVPYDGGIDSERAVSGFTRRWIERLRTSVVVDEQAHVRGGHVRLQQRAWHEVAVLKFVHAHFVLNRPELGQTQRGQARVVEDLVLGCDAWLTDSYDAGRAPRRLLEWVEETTELTFELHRERPGNVDDAALRRQGRARAVLDYVASLSDQQAVSTHRELTGVPAA